jgi:soluble lytic murein transglycosylase-like protein
MTVGLKAPALLEPQNDLSRLRGQKPATIEGEKARLRKASREFEAFFTYFMLKTMRKTVPETPLDEGSPFASGTGKDIFTQMFDMEVSRTLAGKDNNSIGDLLYQSLEKKLVTRSPDATSVLRTKPLQRDLTPEPTRLSPDPIKLVQRDRTAYELRPRNQAPAPVELPEKDTTGSIMSRYGTLIDQAAEATNLDSALIASVIQVESAGDPRAVSRAGAKGLMQLVDSTARDYGVGNVFDPSENIRAGSRYLRNLIDRFGDVKLGLAAYNAGPGNVSKYGGVPPFRETQEYVRKVTMLHTGAGAR